jgi:hypothetical protein
MLSIKKNSMGVVFKVVIQPKSSKNMISGIYGDAVKIKLTAPPVDGAANKMCIKYLSNIMKIPKSRIEILSGHTSRKKNIIIKYDKNSEAEFNSIKNLVKSLI